MDGKEQAVRFEPRPFRAARLLGSAHAQTIGGRLLRRARLSPVYGRLLHKLLGDSYVSTEKARQRLGFEPRYSNREALLRAFVSWRDRPPADASTRGAGRTSREPWRQGVLRAAKVFF